MTYKKIIIFLMIASIVIPAMAKKRSEKFLKQTDLTQLGSPSYVPHPYPNTDQHVIDNLKYAIHALFSPSKNGFENSLQGAEKIDNFLPKFLETKSRVKIKNILKVKNKIAGMPDEYSFLIDLYDPDTQNYARVALDANGLLFGALFSSESSKVKGLKLKHQVATAFEAKKLFNANDIKSIDWVAYDLMIDNPLYPLCEITLKNGSVYYLDYNDIPYRKQSEDYIGPDVENLGMNGPQVLARGEKIIFDSITEKRILLIKL